LFVKTSIPGHSLHHLLPPYRSSNLRERGHSFHLPDYDTVLFKNLIFALYTNLSQLTTNLFLFVFCVLPVCYDVCLSHLNKDYILIHRCVGICCCITSMLLCCFRDHSKSYEIQSKHYSSDCIQPR